MRRVLRRVAPALAAGAIALSTTICPIKAAAESEVIIPTYEFYRDLISREFAWEMRELQEEGQEISDAFYQFWTLVENLYTISQNANEDFQITGNGFPCICGKFRTPDGTTYPVTCLGTDSRVFKKFFVVYSSPIFTTSASWDTPADTVENRLIETSGEYIFSYTPVGEQGNVTVATTGFFSPTSYTVNNRTTWQCRIEKNSSEPVLLQPANFGLYFSPDNNTGYPIGTYHSTYTLPPGNPMQPADYYMSVLRPMFEDVPEIQPYLADIPRTGDVPTFSAPTVPAFSMPYPDFSAFNVGFWWQLTNAIVTACGAQSLIILCLTVGIGVMVVTRFGGGS